jgi:hypothetical protein
MHTFRVVKDPNGWAVRLGEGMTTPFRTRSLAVQQARRLSDSLRRHGEVVEVVIEDMEIVEAARSAAPLEDRVAAEPQDARPVWR